MMTQKGTKFLPLCWTTSIWADNIPTYIWPTFAVRMFLGLLLLVSLMVAYMVKRWLYLSKWDHIPGPKAISRLSFYNIVRLGHLGKIEIVHVSSVKTEADFLSPCRSRSPCRPASGLTCRSQGPLLHPCYPEGPCCCRSLWVRPRGGRSNCLKSTKY